DAELAAAVGGARPDSVSPAGHFALRAAAPLRGAPPCGVALLVVAGPRIRAAVRVAASRGGGPEVVAGTHLRPGCGAPQTVPAPAAVCHRTRARSDKVTQGASSAERA